MNYNFTGEGSAGAGLLEVGPGRMVALENRGTEYVSDSGMKWMSGGALPRGPARGQPRAVRSLSRAPVVYLTSDPPHES